MRGKERLIWWAVASVLALLAASQPAWAADKNKMVRITNKQNAPAEVYINFAADSTLKPTDLPFCKITGPLNCQFTLSANSSQDVPNPQAKYFNMALAFNAPVNCGSTKAEVLVNNPNWYDILDVSVVDGFNEKIQMNLTPTSGCTICAGIKNAPCGDAGAGECKKGSESNPDVLCQYQMNEPTGLVEVLLQP